MKTVAFLLTGPISLSSPSPPPLVFAVAGDSLTALLKSPGEAKLRGQLRQTILAKMGDSRVGGKAETEGTVLGKDEAQYQQQLSAYKTSMASLYSSSPIEKAARALEAQKALVNPYPQLRKVGAHFVIPPSLSQRRQIQTHFTFPLLETK